MVTASNSLLLGQEPSITAGLARRWRKWTFEMEYITVGLQTRAGMQINFFKNTRRLMPPSYRYRRPGGGGLAESAVAPGEGGSCYLDPPPA